MRAALLLRLIEARRRGGPILLATGMLVVAWAALSGGETPDGRYGLATDLAATFCYLAALFFGALPLATDRERKRAYLPGASPVPAWSWALGNAAAAAAIGLIAGACFFGAAAVGGALGGGIETHVAHPFAGRGTQYLPVRLTGLPERTTRLRVLPRVAIRTRDKVGATDSATVEVGGRPYEFYPDVPIIVEVSGTEVVLNNVSPDHVVGIDRTETRALAESRSFLLNALLAGLAPALGAASLGALAAMASALLHAPVAALFAALFLTLASLKGFLVETIEFEGALRQARQAGGAAAQAEGGEASEFARRYIGALLVLVPDLVEFDQTDRVATGEWTGASRTDRALATLAGALALAALLGGIGVHARRLP